MTSTTRTILVFGQLTEIECEDEQCGECSCEDEESGCCSMFGGRMRHAPAQAEPQDGPAPAENPVECEHAWKGHWVESKYTRPGHSFHECVRCDCWLWDDGKTTKSADHRPADREGGERC